MREYCRDAGSEVDIQNRSTTEMPSRHLDAISGTVKMVKWTMRGNMFAG